MIRPKKPFKIIVIDEFNKPINKIKDSDINRLRKKTISIFDKLL